MPLPCIFQSAHKKGTCPQSSLSHGSLEPLLYSPLHVPPFPGLVGVINLSLTWYYLTDHLKTHLNYKKYSLQHTEAI